MRCASVDGGCGDDCSDRSTRFICVDPTLLAQLAIATLVDDDGQRCFVRIDADRWLLLPSASELMLSYNM